MSLKEKYHEYFNESSDRPTGTDCRDCKLATQCARQNSQTVKPICLVSGADISMEITC